MCYGNNYTFKNLGKTAHKYDIILDYVAKNYGKEFTREELFVKSGYLPEYISSGHLCYLTSAMNEYGILNYNPHTRKWSAGCNFFEAYGLKTVMELSR